jgi:outer membrane protein assembly factor BamA
LRIGLLAAAFAAIALASHAAHAPTYILNGYSLSGIPGVKAAELEAKLKHKPGDRITDADVNADQAILAKELKARHIGGELYATVAEKHGRVWIIFDLLNTPQATGPRTLEAQNFEGASHISAGALAAATGLKKGDPLSPQKINAARRAILALYAKSAPGKPLTLKGKMQVKPGGKVTLTWVINEPR